MTYYLGVDIGTTYTAAAVWRDGSVEIASLGNRAPVIPSVVFLRDDGSMLVGEPAARRGAAEPQRVTREFKRRIGDPTPIIIGGTPYSADALIGKVLAWVVGKVTESEGGPPEGITASHPANWGAFKKDLLRQAIRRADLDDVRMVTEPEAAAIHYASQARVEPGAVIAVYDLGGGTFDVALLRKRVAGWEILGEPEGIERLGGVDFDEAVFQHVMTAAGSAFDDLDPDDGATVAAVARLRQECIEAKEALSSDSDVTIPVLLPTLQTEVRLTRAEFEHMIRPTLSDSIAAINRALRSAKVEPGQVTAVLLVGGSSRIPLVSELVSSQLGRPVAVDAHPKYGIALGAAILAADHASAGTAVTTSVRVLPEYAAPAAATAASAAAASAETDSGGFAPAAGTAAAAGLAAGAVGGAAAAAASAPGAAPPTPEPFPPAGPPTADPAAGVARSGGFAAPPPAGSPPGGPGGSGGRPPEPASGRPSGGYGAEAAGYSATQPWPDRPDMPDPGRGGRAAASPATGQVHVPAPPVSGGEPPVGGGGRSTGASGAGGGGDGRNVRPLLVGVAAVVAVIAAVAYVLTLGGDDDDPAETASTGEVSAESTTPPETDPVEVTTTASTTPEATTPFVTIDSVDLEGGQYRVNFTVSGFQPSQEQGGYHSHFYLDDIEASNAGANGNPAIDWDLTYDSGTYLTKYGPADLSERPAEQMCSLVADSAHNIAFPDDTTGNCVPLPAG